MKIAVTGGTGFVGSHLIEIAAAAGHEIHALTRRPQPARASVRWIQGDLSNRDALQELAEDCDAVVHIAGVISAHSAAEFDAGNVDGTLAMLAAATAVGARRFVHVSSLAAREPKISLYGASKAKAEELVAGSGLDWAIVRPPAVYGPGDRETLELFKMAKLGIMLMPPRGRLSVIHVGDLARLLLVLIESDAPSKLLMEADDGTPGGWSHRDFGQALGVAVGKRPLILSAPAALLKLGARADQLIRRSKAKLTADRAAYFSHKDWVIDTAKRPPADVWIPAIPADQGLADTAAWYRSNGWL